jgi:hypothetical protein
MAGAIVLVLLGVVHSLAVIAEPAPQNDTERQLYNLMANYKIPLPGAVRSMAELVRGFNIAFGLLSLSLGLINLAIARLDSSVLKRLALVNVVWLTAMTLNSMYHWFAIPTAFLATALLLFAVSWMALLKGLKPASGAA